MNIRRRAAKRRRFGFVIIKMVLACAADMSSGNSTEKQLKHSQKMRNIEALIYLFEFIFSGGFLCTLQNMALFFVLGCYCPAEINSDVKIMRHELRKIRLMWWSDIWLTNIKVVQRSIVEGVSWGKR